MRFSISVRIISALNFGRRGAGNLRQPRAVSQIPQAARGQLTRKRAALVCGRFKHRAATRPGLGSYLQLDRGEEVVGGRENPSILADTMEAVIAAVYLDAGMEEPPSLVDLAMDGYETSEKNDRDAKSALQEYLQALGEETPDLRDHRAGRPPHARVFTAGGAPRGRQRALGGRGRAQAAPRRLPRRWRCKSRTRHNDARMRVDGSGVAQVRLKETGNIRL